MTAGVLVLGGSSTAPLGENLAALFFSAIRAVRHEFRSEEEKQYADYVLGGIRRFGVPLLGAESQQDLDDLIEETIEGPEFAAHWNGYRTHKAPRASTQVATDHLFDSSVGILGPGTVAELNSAMALLAACRAATESLVKASSASVFLEFETAMQIVRSGSTPVALARAIYALPKLMVSMYGIAAVQLDHHTTERWLVFGLAQRFHANARAFARLVASTPGTDMPTSFVPLEERIDPKVAHAATGAAMLFWKYMVEAAKEQDADTYPSDAAVLTDE